MCYTHKVQDRYLIICWQVKAVCFDTQMEQENTGFAPKYILGHTHLQGALIVEKRGIGYQL